MTSARLRIQGEYRDLMLAWRRTTERWRDPVSRAFEERRLLTIEPRIRSTVSAMEKIESMLDAARRDCGDD
jgi:hypothetical protein